MSKILEELWYGNLCPCEEPFIEQKKYNKLITELENNENLLEEILNDKEKILFENYRTCFHKINTLTEKESFIKGFTLGAKIIMSCTHEGKEKHEKGL